MRLARRRALEGLLEDINKSGFPLELRVSRELLTRGYFVEHNVYYIDKERPTKFSKEHALIGTCPAPGLARDRIVTRVASTLSGRARTCRVRRAWRRRTRA
jgi:hypothetical protein